MEIKKGSLTIRDTMNKLVENKDGFTCGCRNPKLKMVYHIDGRSFYSYQYSCCNCGNSIVMERERDKKNFLW